jgi:hypothetical protein
MVQGRRQVLAKDGKGGIRLVLGDGAAELAQGTRTHQAQHLRFGQDPADE